MHVVLTVQELSEKLKYTVEHNFPYLWVQGEVSSLARPSSGHLYFQLKDGDALLSCVWFKSQQGRYSQVDPLTGEVFENQVPEIAKKLANGQELLCAGQLTIYPSRGTYQLIVDMVQDQGAGLLHLEFEAMRQKLAVQGLFALEHKRKIPKHPHKIALITSPSGAAIQDFLRIAENRGYGANLRLYPVQVQGKEAPEQIIKAIKIANQDIWKDGLGADVIAIIRGGGSAHDLAAFNDENMAREIYSSKIPVVTGIGHEIDTSIADLVADLRLATPSHVAQSLWQERTWYMQQIDDFEINLERAFELKINQFSDKLHNLNKALGWLSPKQKLQRLEENLNNLSQALPYYINSYLEKHIYKLKHQQNFLIQKSNSLAISEENMLNQHDIRLKNSSQNYLNKLEYKIEHYSVCLEKYDPQEPLKQGYALIKRQGNKFVRSISDISLNEQINIIVSDGSFKAKIEEIKTHTV